MITVRELTYKERAYWGTCPICGAKHGERCKEINSLPGIDLATGAHVARLVNAPHTAATEDDQP